MSVGNQPKPDAEWTKSLAAMNAVVAALRDLPADERERVIRSVAILLDIKGVLR